MVYLHMAYHGRCHNLVESAGHFHEGTLKIRSFPTLCEGIVTTLRMRSKYTVHVPSLCCAPRSDHRQRHRASTSTTAFWGSVFRLIWRLLLALSRQWLSPLGLSLSVSNLEPWTRYAPCHFCACALIRACAETRLYFSRKRISWNLLMEMDEEEQQRDTKAKNT